MTRKTDHDWPAIEADYCAGVLRISEISRKHGAPETTIYSRAKRSKWVRLDPAIKAKRVRDEVANPKAKTVNQKMSVSAEGSDTVDIVNAAIDQDVQDMNLGLENARKALKKANTLMDDINIEAVEPGQEDIFIKVAAKDLKSLVDVTKTSIETIRKIRGLDDDQANDDLSGLSIEELRAEIEKLEAQK